MEWLPMESSPKDGTSIILLCGETIPDQPFVTTACFIKGDEVEDVGYPAYAKYGAWLVWSRGAEDYYCMDVCEPTGWMTLPPSPALQEQSK